MKCKGCTGEVTYTPLAQVEPNKYFASGPALVHAPYPPCEWFTVTSAVEILKHIAIDKAQQERGNYANTLLFTC